MADMPGEQQSKNALAECDEALKCLREVELDEAESERNAQERRAAASVERQ